MIDLGGGMIFPDAYLREQFTPAEEARQADEERRQEMAEDFLVELEPDEDPYA